MVIRLNFGMKRSGIILVSTTLILASSCSDGGNPSESRPGTDLNSSHVEESSLLTISSEESSVLPSSQAPSIVPSSSPNSEKPASSTQSTITVPAHTLKDANPPINVSAKGDVVDQNTWDSFRYAGQRGFEGNYNYTYTTNSGGDTIEAFTKNGYYMKTAFGELLYERNKGDEFYSYTKTKQGYLREEDSIDLKDKYTYRIQHEIYVHMFDFEDYEYDPSDGSYRYDGGVFASVVKFQGGYFTYLKYNLGSMYFQISATFQTEINIPESYYYQ